MNKTLLTSAPLKHLKAAVLDILSWSQSLFIKSQVENGDIKDIYEYDAAVYKAKTSVLESASLEKKDEFMNSLLEDVRVR